MVNHSITLPLTQVQKKTAAKIAPYARGTVTIKDIAQTEQDSDLYVVNF